MRHRALPTFGFRTFARIGAVPAALVCVATGTVIGLALRPWVTTTVPFITMFPAVAAAASVWGSRAGFLTTFLAGLSAAYFFIPPAATLDNHDVVPVAVFWAGASVVSAIGGSLHEARARAEARAKELDAVIEAVPDAVIVADAGGRIRSRNAAADRLLGRLPETIEAVRSLLVDEGEDRRARVRATGRSVRPMGVPISGATDAQILMLRDMTELDEVEAARDAVLGILSHELRTPITTIYAGAALLGRELPKRERDELAADITTESDRLYRLVEDLLVLSRFERGHLEFVPEPVLLQRVLPRVANKEQLCWADLCVDVSGIAPNLPPVTADETYVEQVTRNLIANAAKYAGTRERVSVGATRVGDHVIVAVEDHGPGVPADERDTIFQLFKRGSAAKGVAGSGIGLFVCRRLVELMGGTITVRTAATGGAVFEFSLPVYANVEAE